MKRRGIPDPATLIGGALGKVQSPLAIILGSPGEVAELAAALPVADVTCYQMDLYQAERLQKELSQRELPTQVRTAPDLWDLPAQYKTLIYPVPRGGERSLKIDMIEQAYHVLAPSGILAVFSAYEKEQFIPALLKKVFRRVHAPAAGLGVIFTCQRRGERPRRRHEVCFQVQSEFGRSLRFLSRPGVFSYGRFDDGARALVETMEIQAGDHVLDLGCGCGTNGIFAGLRSGAGGFTVFVDSNVRAVTLTEINARALGLQHFQAVAASTPRSFPDDRFDVVLANPPYYAQQSIAAMFIDEAHRLLRPEGRLYLVTKQPDIVGSLIIETFGDVNGTERRGYHVLSARK